MLRVILEGVTEENARMTTVTVTGVDKRTFQRREGLPTSGRVDSKTEGALIRNDSTHSYAPKWPAEIRGSWPCQGLTSQFDLDPFFADVAEQHEILRVDELEVHVDHSLHLLERIRVPLYRGVKLKSGRTIYEVRVRLVPAGVIHGRLTRAGGAPAVEGWVGALLLEESNWARPTTVGSTLTDIPIDGEGRAVECTADGAFELRVPVSGRYALASLEEGRRPTTTRVAALVGTRVDVGTIVLESGHAISGHTLRLGNPMAGATVSLTQRRVFWAADPADVEKGMNAWISNRRTFTTRTRSKTLAWLESRFELLGQRASANETGAFAFGGLAPRDYRLRVVELAGSRFLPSGWDNPAFGEEGPDEMVVRAPAHGVVMEFNWASIRFELKGDLKSEDKGRMVLRTKSLYPGNERTFIPEFWSTQIPLSGNEVTFALQAPPAKHMLGEVMFPGRQPVPLDFWTPQSGGEVVIPVELVPAAKAGDLSDQAGESAGGDPRGLHGHVVARRSGQSHPGRAAGEGFGGSTAPWRASAPESTACACARARTRIILGYSSTTSSSSISHLPWWSRGPSGCGRARGCASRCATRPARCWAASTSSTTTWETGCISYWSWATGGNPAATGGQAARRSILTEPTDRVPRSTLDAISL